MLIAPRLPPPLPSNWSKRVTTRFLDMAYSAMAPMSPCSKWILLMSSSFRLEISSRDCNIVLNPMFRLCVDPLGKIFPDKNKTAVASESSCKCEMYCEIMSTFLFLLGVDRIDSHVSTKVKKKTMHCWHYLSFLSCWIYP